MISSEFPKPLRRAILLWDACQRLLLYVTEKYISITHFSASIDTKLNIIISSRPGVLFKIDVIKNNAKFTKKQLLQSLYFNLDFNKVAGRGTATSLKKRLDTHVFLYICCEIFKSTCFTENLQAICILMRYSNSRSSHLRPAALLKKRPWDRLLPLNFAKYLTILTGKNCVLMNSVQK